MVEPSVVRGLPLAELDGRKRPELSFQNSASWLGKPGTYSNATIVELSRTGGAKSYTVFHRSASKNEAYIEDEDFSEQNSTGRLRGFRGAAMVELHLWRLSNKSSAALRVRASNRKTDLRLVRFLDCFSKLGICSDDSNPILAGGDAPDKAAHGSEPDDSVLRDGGCSNDMYLEM